MNAWEATDLASMRALQSVHTPWMDTFFVWLTDPPHREIYFIVAALALIVLGGKKGRIAALTLAIAITLTDQAVAGWIKPAFDRVRPCFAHADEVRFLLEKQSRSPSFPSAHAANAFAFALVMLEFRRKVGILALGLAALIAYSRPYVGVHYPFDVLGGAALGTAIALGTIGARRGLVRVWLRYRRRAVTPPLRPEDARDETPSPPDRPDPPREDRSPRRADP